MMRSIWPVRGYVKLGLSAALLFELGARAFSQSPTATSDPPVVLDSGAITGVRSAAAPEIRAYLGVPFAAPPVGPLRWQPPRPPTKWEAVRACDHLGPACPQPGSPLSGIGGGSETQSEDCLYLNVWTPARNAEAKLPVMVWIHGGAFFLGSGGGSSYDGANLAQKNVVVVTINYRLGPFGFLCHPALSKESGRGASGNYGLLDQIEALRWVQRNIATFGGDPKNVTIFGESAGGFSIGCLLISPLAKGLFQRAIAESGVAIWITRKLKEGSATEPAAEDSGVRVLKALVGDATDVLAAARAKSAAEVLKAGNPGLRLTAVGDTVSYGPVTDGWVIPEEPWRLFEEGKVNLVPFLAGTNADEGTMFLGEGAGMTADQHDAQIHSAYGAAGDRLATFYSVKRWQSVASARSQMIGDSIFVAPTRAQVRALSDAGAHCYLYQFTRITGRNFMGAYHSAEIAYVFGHVDNRIMQRYDATDQKLSATMMDYWVQFARTGDPNREGLPTWPVYVTEKDPHLELGDTVKAGTGLHADACDLWDELMASWRKP